MLDQVRTHITDRAVSPLHPAANSSSSYFSNHGEEMTARC
jgi:hypothetical protein